MFVVRIHVERVKDVLKQKCTILQGTLPISLLSDSDDDNEDKIVSLLCMYQHVSTCSANRISVSLSYFFLLKF